MGTRTVQPRAEERDTAWPNLFSGGFPLSFGKFAPFEELVHPLLVKVGLSHAYTHTDRHRHTITHKHETKLKEVETL